MEIVRPIFHSFFEDTTMTDNILKSRIYNTSCIEIYTLFAIFNNKELRNFKGRPTHSILYRMDHGFLESPFRYECYEVGYAELASQ